jgi:MSHA biogenesis protein MshQ
VTGCDIAFMAASGGAQLDHEIEAYDGTTGTLVAWVRIPSLTGVNSTIFIYYGDPDVTCPQNTPPGSPSRSTA